MKKILGIFLLGSIAFNANAQEGAVEAAMPAPTATDVKKSEVVEMETEAKLTDEEVKARRQRNAEFEAKKSDILNSKMSADEKKIAIRKLERELGIETPQKTKPKSKELGTLE